MLGLIRIILIGLLVGLILLIAKRWLRKRLEHRGPLQGKNAQRSKVLQCQVCGVYVPAEEAIHAGEHIYCCEEHKQADQHQ